MKHSEIDNIWRSLLNKEKLRLASLPANELMALGRFTSCEIPNGETAIDYGLWHEDPEFRSDKEVHSFILQTRRKIFLFISKNYLVGFSLDKSGKVIPIPDDILCAYD